MIAIVRLSGNTAINVAKLQEQLAKNVTIYTTGTNSGGVINTGTGSGTGSGSGSGKADQTADGGDSVSIETALTFTTRSFLDTGGL